MEIGMNSIFQKKYYLSSKIIISTCYFMKTNISVLLILITLASSCVNQKKLLYFQAENKNKETETQDIQQQYITKLKAGDILGIMVSSFSPEASALFNPYMATGANQASGSTIPQATGYLIDTDGFITLPLVGKLKVAGLNTTEAAEQITQQLNQYLVQPTVNVRILNFRISILGEVNHPSVYTIANEAITLPEALSMAGDLTVYGKRNNILIIREADNKRAFARIDITDRNVFKSPYYYLHANDIVYIEPVKTKAIATSRTMQLLPTILSVMALVITIFFTVTKL